MHLYEAHLPVSDTKIAQRFYVEIVGLRFAHRDLTRDVVFLWAGADKKIDARPMGPEHNARQRVSQVPHRIQCFA